MLRHLRLGRDGAIVALAVMLGGCGGGSSSPTTPTTPAPSATPTPAVNLNPSVRDGLGNQVVAAARMTPPNPGFGDRISVTADGYMVREQLFERADIFLWPGAPDYIRELAYWEFDDDSLRLIRWSSGFTLTLEGELADDPGLVRKTEEVAAEASRHIGFPVLVGRGGSVTIGVEPELENEDAVAEARLDTRGAGIVGARIVFRRRAEISGGPQARYTNTLLHEVGHVIGLSHSPDDRDVMTPGEGPGTRFAVYQPGEAGCLRMIYVHRRAGNRFPDRDPALGAASLARLRTTVIRD
jgi:hypothetical protein